MSADGKSLKHDAFPYGSDEALVEAMAPFLRDGLAQGHAAVGIVSPRNIAVLKDALGSDATRVHWFDAAAFFVRPAAAIAELDAVIWELTSDGRPLVRLVTELPFGPTIDEQAAWTRYEAIVNRAFERSPLWAVCLYDTRTLPPQVVRDADRTHQAVWEGDRRKPGPGLVDPAVLLREIPEPTWTPVGEPTLRLTIDAGQDGWRDPVTMAVAHGGLPDDRVQDFLVAVTEVVANALQHGDDTAELVLWVAAAGVVCEVRDHGQGLDDPFVGFLPPGGDTAPRGMGLWVARQLSDTLAIESGPEGTTVRLAIGR